MAYKSLVEWWGDKPASPTSKEDSKEDEAAKVEIEVEVNSNDEEENSSANVLKALTISNLVSHMLSNIAIGGEKEKLKGQISEYLEMLSKLLEDV